MTELTKEQKKYVDQLAMERVYDMNNDDVLVNALEKKSSPNGRSFKGLFPRTCTLSSKQSKIVSSLSK
ncbi:hypothetical protein ABRP32_16890 [Providencia manganoxydans]|uniref:hypothetical protein n=1 Tax=Providencia manganoxydans TaxID=2923283 RepID=UPI003AF36B96